MVESLISCVRDHHESELSGQRSVTRRLLTDELEPARRRLSEATGRLKVGKPADQLKGMLSVPGGFGEFGTTVIRNAEG